MDLSKMRFKMKGGIISLEDYNKRKLEAAQANRVLFNAVRDASEFQTTTFRKQAEKLEPITKEIKKVEEAISPPQSGNPPQISYDEDAPDELEEFLNEMIEENERNIKKGDGDNLFSFFEYKGNDYQFGVHYKIFMNSKYKKRKKALLFDNVIEHHLLMQYEIKKIK